MLLVQTLGHYSKKGLGEILREQFKSPFLKKQEKRTRIAVVKSLGCLKRSSAISGE